MIQRSDGAIGGTYQYRQLLRSIRGSILTPTPPLAGGSATRVWTRATSRCVAPSSAKTRIFTTPPITFASSSAAVETRFKSFLEAKELGFGQVLLPFRIALTGEGGGPSMFDFAAFIGQEATLQRLRDGVAAVEEMRDHD